MEGHGGSDVVKGPEMEGHMAHGGSDVVKGPEMEGHGDDEIILFEF